MSLSAAAIRLLGAKGLTVDEIADVAEANAPEKTLSAGAERTRRWRERKAGASRGDVTEMRHGDVSHVGEGAQVVNPSLPSLRSEELKPPVSPSGLTAPKGSETARGTRLPDDWSPPLGLDAGDFGLSHEAYADQVAIFRDYWRAVPGAKGRKSDWPATWRNWLRRAADNSARKAPHDRPDPDAKLAARHANYARAWEGSERAAGRDWKP